MDHRIKIEQISKEELEAREQPKRVYSQVLGLFEAGDWMECLDAIDQISTTNEELWRDLAVIKAACLTRFQSNKEEVREMLLAVNAKDRKHAMAYYELGYSFYMDGLFEPEVIDMFVNAMKYSRGKGYEKAKILSLKVSELSAKFTQATEAFEKGDGVTASAALQFALQLDPGNPSIQKRADELYRQYPHIDLSAIEIEDDEPNPAQERNQRERPAENSENLPRTSGLGENFIAPEVSLLLERSSTPISPGERGRNEEENLVFADSSVYTGHGSNCVDSGMYEDFSLYGATHDSRPPTPTAANEFAGVDGNWLNDALLQMPQLQALLQENIAPASSNQAIDEIFPAPVDELSQMSELQAASQEAAPIISNPLPEELVSAPLLSSPQMSGLPAGVQEDAASINSNPMIQELFPATDDASSRMSELQGVVQAEAAPNNSNPLVAEQVSAPAVPSSQISRKRRRQTIAAVPKGAACQSSGGSKRLAFNHEDVGPTHHEAAVLPSVPEMVFAAIGMPQKPRGLAFKAIKEFVVERYKNADVKELSSQIEAVLEKAVAGRILVKRYYCYKFSLPEPTCQGARKSERLAGKRVFTLELLFEQEVVAPKKQRVTSEGRKRAFSTK